MTLSPPFAQVLRDLPVLTVDGPTLGVDTAADAPLPLLASWLQEAIDAGVLEPHAMTLATAGADGLPDARVLIAKNVDEQGVWFASSSVSAKGRQLAETPYAAVTFYWPALGRSVRIRGRVTPGSAAQSEADFRARGVSARAVALASQESEPLASADACATAVAGARRDLALDRDLVDPAWTLYVLTPEHVEFWAADAGRQHGRLCYTLTPDGWGLGLLWP